MLTLEQQKLVTENHNLIYKVLNDLKANLDDYYDIAAIGLCKAGKKYKEGKSSFSTYAYSVMKNEIVDKFRSNSATSKIGMVEISTEQTMGSDDGKCRILDTISSNDDTEDKIITGEVLTELNRHLTDTEKQILRSLLNDKTYSEIVEEVGISKTRICQLRKRIGLKYNKIYKL